MHASEPVSVSLNWRPTPPTSVQTYLEKPKTESPPSDEESPLLKTIRATLRGRRIHSSSAINTSVISSPDEDSAEEELFWDKYNVVLTSGGIIRKRWCFEREAQPVQWACQGWFEQPTNEADSSMRPSHYTVDPQDETASVPDPKQRPTFGPFARFARERGRQLNREPPALCRAVVIFLRSLGKLFFMNGSEYTFNVPFVVRGAWPLRPNGILIQRTLDVTELEESLNSGEPPLPTIFSMINPHAEAAAVGLTAGIVGGSRGIPASLKDDDLTKLNSVSAQEHVLWVSPHGSETSDDLVVTLDMDATKISVWRYAYVPNKGRPSSLNMPARTQNPRSSLGGNARQSGFGPQSPRQSGSFQFPPTAPSVIPTMHTMHSSSMVPPSSGPRQSLSGVTADRTPHSKNINPVDIISGDKMRAEYYIERLVSVQIPTTDTESWRSMSVAAFDQRYDGLRDGCLLGFCLPYSKQLIIVDVERQLTGSVVASERSNLSAISIAPVRATRPGIDDLLVLKPDKNLILLTYGTSDSYNEVPIQIMTGPQINVHGHIQGMYLVESQPPKPISLRDGLGSSVTLCFGNGMDFRISIDLAPRDLLTRQCLMMLALMLPDETFFKLHHTFLRKWSHQKYSATDGETFQLLCSVLLETLDIADHPAQPISVDNNWEALDRTSSLTRFAEDPALKLLKLPPNTPNSTLTFPPGRKPHKYLPLALYALHMVAQNNIIATNRHGSLRKLVPMICKLAMVVRPEWADYWKRLFPDAIDVWPASPQCNSPAESLEISLQTLAPDFWSSPLWTLLNGQGPRSKISWTESHNKASEFGIKSSLAFGRMDPLAPLHSLVEIYDRLGDKSCTDYVKRAERAVRFFVSAQGRGACDAINRLSLGLAAPLKEAMRTCQMSPQVDWPVMLYRMIGRDDLAEGISENPDPMFNYGYRSVKDYILPMFSRKSIGEHVEDVRKAVMGEVNVSGVELNLQHFTDVRFGKDKRLEDVARMLCSSYIQTIKIIERPELSEHDQAKEQQMQVVRIAERTLALPLGRALFTFGSVSVVTREAFVIPKMEYSIRLQQQNILLVPESGKIPYECASWGEFHNGVAAGLRISSQSNAIESSWIKYNKPTELTPEHAGFLFALGLSGHLREMLTWHTFSYLTPKHDLTSIAVLLGLSAANIGTSNRHVTKLLAVHTPALLPTPNVDLNVPLITQTAGISGVGLLYLGTKNRRYAEVCLNQISRKDLVQPELSNEYREAYTISAALSFGMIMLGKGTNIPADVALQNRLAGLVQGRGVTKMDEENNEIEHIAVDINLTCPAATIALGLMYLRTERRDVADILSIPDTILALDRIQPSFLLLKTLARSLIMWNTITPDNGWLMSQVPPGIAKAMEARFQGKDIHDSFDLAYYNILAGACFAIGLKYAGTAREAAYVLMIRYYDLFSKLAYSTNGAFDQRIKRSAVRDGLSLISISLCMVMAGTGEINCLRRLRYAYGMYNQPVRYGTHVATHVAIGLLFLGGGRFTLGSSDAAIACMVAAFFPRFAQVSSDNKSYLQALRHLWVLAVEPRCLITRDVDTKEVVYLPLKLKVKDVDGVAAAQLVSPTLIPDVDKLLSIRVDTPRYWPFYLDIANIPRHRESLLRSQTLYVKRRTAFLSYMEDPKGSRNLWVRPGAATSDAAMLDFPVLTAVKSHTATNLHQFISSFSNDKFFLGFADWFCGDNGETDDERLFQQYCHSTLLDSILQDKIGVIQSYLTLLRNRKMSPGTSLFNLTLRDLRFASEFYNRIFDQRFTAKTHNNPRAPLLRKLALSGAILALDRQVEPIRKDPEFSSMLRRYSRGEGLPAQPSTSSTHLLHQTLSWYLLRNNVPVSTMLIILRALAVTSHNKFVSEPPPVGTSNVGLLDAGIKEVLHTTGTTMTPSFGTGWSIRSVEEILASWDPAEEVDITILQTNLQTRQEIDGVVAGT